MKDQNDSKIQIRGRVVARRSGQPLARARVEAWDMDLAVNRPLARAVTDSSGQFELAIDAAFARDADESRNPQAFFRVFAGRRLIGSTEGGVVWGGRGGARRKINLEVSAPGIDERLPPLEIGSFDELIKREREILERIAGIPNGGNLFLINPLMLLEDAGVVLSERARRELIRREPALAGVSPTPYNALKASVVPQRTRVRLNGLFKRRAGR